MKYTYSHYTDAVADVKALRSRSKGIRKNVQTIGADPRELGLDDVEDELEKLLLWCIDEVEIEHRKHGWGVAPWYYQELAKLYRLKKNYSAEIGVIMQFLDLAVNNPHRSGLDEMEQRLRRATILMENSRNR